MEAWEGDGVRRLKIGSIEIGPGCPCLIVAEIGVNFNGDVDLATRMIRVAAQCGAGAVKFQRRNIDAILTRAAQEAPYLNERSFGATYGAHRRALEFPDAAWPMLRTVANVSGVLLFATPYDPDSAKFLGRLGVPCVKVASCDVTNPPLLEAVGALGVPVIMSTGMSTEEEIDRAVRTIWRYTQELVLMNCVSTYPSEAKDLNLRYMLKLAKRYRCIVGHSGHERGIQTTLAAVTLGAAVVERHLTLDRSSRGPDHAASLEPNGLTRLVRDIRRIEEALIERPKVVLPSERAIRDRLAKSVVAARLIRRGELVERAALGFKGPGTGLPPYRSENLVGRTALQDIVPDTLISEAMLSPDRSTRSE